jgi:Zn-dependent protease
MHDPFAWSFPLGRLFGITIRVHVLFPFVVLGLILHTALGKAPGGIPYPPGHWIDVTIVMAILFVSILLHEFGHCFAARSVQGDAQEVLLWPLGGLANVDVPHRPRAHFITAAAGPAVNVVLAVVCALLLLVVADQPYQPSWNPLPSGFPFRDPDHHMQVVLTPWRGGPGVEFSPYSLPAWLARIGWLNYFLFLINIVLVGFPMDAGRMLQAALWPSLGYRQATLTAVFAGFVVVFIVGLYAIICSEVLALCLALFIYVSCQRQWVVLETGGDEGVFGYDFSQGYTSLERDQPATSPPPPRRVSWWRRWLQRRAAKRMQREQEQREAEERRLDELLDKVHREGQASLTDEERRFMKRVSDRYKHRR